MFELLFVLSVLVGAAIVLATDRFRMDLVGFAALTLLLLSGILTVPEALAGFADPTVHMIGGLFIVGAAAFETGLADKFGTVIERVGGASPRRLLTTILLATASLSALLSSTGTVAIMVPVVSTLARKAHLSPSKLMIPLAFATLLGGMLTLIATAPNIVVSTDLEQAGYEPFGFFDFTGPGLCLVAIGVVYLVFYGEKRLPERVPAQDRLDHRPSTREMWERYGLEGWIAELRIRPDSPLVGKTIAESDIRTRHRVAIFAVRSNATRSTRDRAPTERAQADRVLRSEDLLTVKGAPDAVAAFCQSALLDEVGCPTALPDGLVTAELLVPPGSSLVGRSVRDARLRNRFDVTVAAVFRTREVLRESVAETTLYVGDLLLLLGTSKALVRLRDDLPDTILVTESEALKKAPFRLHRAPHALLVVAAMLSAMTFNLTSPVTAVMCAALAMVVLGCVDASSAERSVNWESLLLIATFLPMSAALTKVGATEMIAKGLVDLVGTAGPRAIMAALFAVTVLVGVVISNTATAVLVAPIAVQIAASLDIRPHALLMTVGIASSCAFLTPVSSPVNMLVVNAGAYRFSDFSRVGAPLVLLMGLSTLVIVPLFFPFH